MKNFLCLQLICPLCIRCGSFQVYPSFFCVRCENSFLLGRLQIQYRYLLDYKVQYLINWQSGESDSLSQLVYLLKSRWSQNSWKYYSKFFSLTKDDTLIAIVPAPGRTAPFAQAMSELTGYKTLTCLGRARDFQSQKTLNINSRSMVEFYFIEEFTNVLRQFDRIILIDDIITSGATLSACIDALKPHLKRGCQIDIIALFSRAKV